MNDLISTMDRATLEQFAREAKEKIVDDRAAIDELTDALQSAINQVEYMHRKFQETGSGNGFISQWQQLISKHTQRKEPA